MIPEDERRKIYLGCSRSVDGNPLQTPRQMLTELATWTPPDLAVDRYGQGGAVTKLEEKVATLLGKESVAYFTSGTMAQPIALRVWCDQRNRPHVAFHPHCHLEVHEQRGYHHLHGLSATLIGERTRLLTANDISSLREPIGAVLLELPQRDLGGLLPRWDDLVAQVEAIRALGAAVHLDGARLWECQPYYGKPLAEIAGLFDSVYLSFYKTLGAISGAVLAGPADFIQSARVWQRRQGGNLFQQFPEALSCLRALSVRLPKVPLYVKAARDIASVMREFPRVRVMPEKPHVNMFQAYFEGDREALLDACYQVSRETGIRFVNYLAPTEVPGWWRYEVTAAEASLGVTDGELRGWLERLFELAEN